MFRRFAGTLPDGANGLFLQHPSVLSTLLEVGWQFRAHDGGLPFGDPRHKSSIPGLPNFWLDSLRQRAGIDVPVGTTTQLEVALGTRAVLWDHLIYAYMIENTRVYEIFRRVLHEFLHGEKLGAPTVAAQQWLRVTEELFYRDPPPFSITAVTSDIRSDMRASRRNAYWRMFGMDLNHGAEDGQPYPYVKADVANNEFVTMFEEFLREVWIAIANVSNTSGANPKDPGKIENIVTNLQNMLMSRRLNGNLSREEFVFVSMMAWFHLTLEFDSPIIQSLRAEATGPEQRLNKVAQRVGLPMHGLSKSFFDIADPISMILILIEAIGTGIVPGLVAIGIPPTPLNALQTAMNTIITHWSLITGRDMKAGKVAVR